MGLKHNASKCNAMTRHSLLDSTLRSRAVDLAAIIIFALILMWAAVWNRFPLIFPDSATYLDIAYGHEYAIDRSSFYGLILKPIISPLPGMAGLWTGVFVQCLCVAGVVGLVSRQVIPQASLLVLLPFFVVLSIVTSVAWHAGQYMPDAFTGITVLLGWLAASRDPSDDGAPALWVAASVMALMHYTHIPLLLVVALATIFFSPTTTGRLRSAGRRIAAVVVSVGVSAAIVVGANGVVLGRWSMTPMAPAFLFARLTEDGLTKPWLRDNCGKTAPKDLCAISHEIPDDSQILLWNGASPYAARIWYPPSDGERWRWVGMLSVANMGAIGAQPLNFVANAVRGGARQFVSFQAIDDECPHSCWSLASGPAHALTIYRPDTVKAYRASRQVNGKIPRYTIRAITTPIAALSLMLVPLLFWLAVRRGDRLIQSLLAAVAVALIVNADLAGALSDVHDRYQSRLVWVVPFVVVLTILRWRQTFKRSRISLPGLK